jgi:hypothetical protein
MKYKGHRLNREFKTVLRPPEQFSEEAWERIITNGRVLNFLVLGLLETAGWEIRHALGGGFLLGHRGRVYRLKGFRDKLHLSLSCERGVGRQETPEQDKEALEEVDAFLIYDITAAPSIAVFFLPTRILSTEEMTIPRDELL